MESRNVKETYTLVICEKPDAARRIAEALSGGGATAVTVAGVQTFRFARGGEDFVACAAQGHLYALSDPFDERSVYPVFDLEWFEGGSVEKAQMAASRRIEAIRELARAASRFLNACDYDVEGEAIGFNILRYACGGKEREAARMRFSTLTKDELIDALDGARERWNSGNADAGRTRHLVDFVWGVNFSRALSQSVLRSGGRYSTVSIGRVQGPTLKFVVEREREIRAFVPHPFWTATGAFEKDGKRVAAEYSGRILRKADAEELKAHVGETGTVTDMSRSRYEITPPPPFNIGELQKEAYRQFGYTPSRTLQIAEMLYLDALISYPRTDSQKLPPSIGYGKILHGLGQMTQYSKHVEVLLSNPLRASQGGKDDPAHPAIHPTGERPRSLDAQRARLFDLVARRFLSVFAPPAKREEVHVEVSVGESKFRLAGKKTLAEGWMEYYAPYSAAGDHGIPEIAKGEELKLSSLEVRERSEQKPVKYSQGSLLAKMEDEGIGTKATRADVITVLVRRGYATGEPLTATDLGFSVVETMERYAGDILSTRLTRSVEGRLEMMEGGRDDSKELVRETVRTVMDQLIELGSNEEKVGRDIGLAARAVAAARYSMGRCPVCGTGELRLIRSKKTGKRFVGCSNYPQGCGASAPLPQRGVLRVAPKPCSHCAWPVVYVTSRRFRSRLCVNPRCSSKVGRAPVFKS